MHTISVIFAILLEEEKRQFIIFRALVVVALSSNSTRANYLLFGCFLYLLSRVARSLARSMNG